jgi:hypothetical protein
MYTQTLHTYTHSYIHTTLRPAPSQPSYIQTSRTYLINRHMNTPHMHVYMRIHIQHTHTHTFVHTHHTEVRAFTAFGWTDWSDVSHVYKYDERQTQEDAGTLEDMYHSFDGSERGSLGSRSLSPSLRSRSLSPSLRHEIVRENGSVHRHVNDDVYMQQQRNRSPSSRDEGIFLGDQDRRSSPVRGNGASFESATRMVWGQNMYKDEDMHAADASRQRSGMSQDSAYVNAGMHRYSHEADVIVVAGYAGNSTTGMVMMSTGDVSDSESVEYDTHNHSVGHSDSVRARGYGDVTSMDQQRSRAHVSSAHVSSTSSMYQQYAHEGHDSEADVPANRSRGHSSYSYGDRDAHISSHQGDRAAHRSPHNRGDGDVDNKTTGKDYSGADRDRDRDREGEGEGEGALLARKSVLKDSKSSPTRRSPTDIIAQVHGCVCVCV